MVKRILDATLLDRLAPGDCTLEICDPSGHTVGYFHPSPGRPQAKSSTRSPFSDEELQRRRHQRAGRPLAEILEQLERSCDIP
jgi:hypothetical protein